MNNDNIEEWTGLRFADATRIVENRDLWLDVVRVSASSDAPQI